MDETALSRSGSAACLQVLTSFYSGLPQFPCLGWLAVTSMFTNLGDEFFSAYQWYLLLEEQSNSGARPEHRNYIFLFLLLRASYTNFCQWDPCGHPSVLAWFEADLSLNKSKGGSTDCKGVCC